MDAVYSANEYAPSSGDPYQDIDTHDIIDAILAYDPKANVSKIIKAAEIAKQYHGSQKRESGKPYYSHPLEVAMIITEMRLDTDSVVTAILHDTLEDTTLTYADIEKEFGETVAKLVNGVTKLTKIDFQPEHIRQAENFRKLLFAMSEDIRVLLVKLADRLHNMRTIQFINDPNKRIRIALETAEIYAPLAERIGIQQLKVELHDIAFSVLHPDIRQSIVNRLDQLTNGHEHITNDIVAEIQTMLADSGLKCTVSGRQKTPYSIWMKMKMKNVGFDQLADIIAFRIIVDNVQDCYQALGYIHAAYSMVPDNFQDFISTPKSNGYQSLHTVVIGPSKRKIEVQIRTHEMHEIAELGVAAHWRYKQNYSHTGGIQYRWIRELIGILEKCSDPEEFIQNAKMAMDYGQVFCFTPKGQLITLPKGATTVDFAYAVHSDVGNHCSGAKINGRLSPLRTVLKNGDQVEIITSQSHTPSPTWEQFVVTGKARAEIRKFIYNTRDAEFSRLGQAILEKNLKSASNTDTYEQELVRATSHFNKKNIQELYIAVGEGTITKEQVIRFLHPIKNVITNTISLLTRDKKYFKQNSKSKSDKADTKAIEIQGLVSGMAVHYAKCCHPLPGDHIVGVIHTGKGTTIHTSDCNLLENLARQPERIIELSWSNHSNERTYLARVKVVLANAPGALAELASTIAASKSNITNMRITNRSVDFFDFLMDIEVSSSEHLSELISRLQSTPKVYDIERVNE